MGPLKDVMHEGGETKVTTQIRDRAMATFVAHPYATWRGPEQTFTTMKT